PPRQGTAAGCRRRQAPAPRGEAEGRLLLLGLGRRQLCFPNTYADKRQEAAVKSFFRDQIQ
ncbi:unnamed protein product, partial [Urochloa humidicola]